MIGITAFFPAAANSTAALPTGGIKDAFGHTQLGGVAPSLVDFIKQQHGYKCHWSVADYLQRAARHIASATDVDHCGEYDC